MSQENVETVRAMYDAFNRGDAEAARAPLHPDVELHQEADTPDTGSYYGLEAFRRGFARWLTAWEGFRFDVEELIDAGDSVVMRVRLSGRAKASGVELEHRLYHVWDFEDGRGRRVRVLRDRTEALEAVGLSEQDAHADS
jgi:ketosteroid isomerase-like protein